MSLQHFFGRKDLTRIQPLKRYLCSLACCLVFNSLQAPHVLRFSGAHHHRSADVITRYISFSNMPQRQRGTWRFWWGFSRKWKHSGPELTKKKKSANLNMFSDMWPWHVTHWETARVLQSLRLWKDYSYLFFCFALTYYNEANIFCTA